MLALFKRASEAKKINVPEEFICSDVIDGTNLIVRDGYDKYVYIHRSIQEYFSAKCISQLNIGQKNTFLTKYSNLETRKKNVNMLAMLSHIDPICFYKSYIIPLLEKNGVLSEGKVICRSKSCISEFVDGWQVALDADDDEGVVGFSQYNTKQDEISCHMRSLTHVLSLKGIAFDDDAPSIYLMTGGEGSISKYLKSIPPRGNIEKSSGDFLGEVFGEDLDWVTLSEIKQFIELYDERVVTPIYESYLKAINEMQKIIDEEYINKIESDSIISGMLNDMGY